jgi:hypothetical protein
MTHVLNQQIDVTAYYFTKGKTFPRRIQFGEQELTFIESGLRCLVNKGQDLIEIFNMSDGRDQYTIRHEPLSRHWILLNKRSLA